MTEAPILTAPEKLDPREEHFRIPSPHPGLSLFLRHLPPVRPAEGTAPRVVLYVHGGTFSSALSIAHRFDGFSWRDDLAARGFHVWGLDFHGFGAFSDPYPEMALPAEGRAPLGRAADASRQLEAAVRFILAHHRLPRLSLIAHSWGTIVTGDFAGRCPELVERLVFFGPIARRDPVAGLRSLPAWRLVTLQDQWDRFTGPVPKHETPVLDGEHFAAWGERYLASDPEGKQRSPAAVKVPSGAFQDIYDAWAGRLAYDPSRISAPVAILRGEWDDMCTNADADFLFCALSGAAGKRDIKIARATHLMHLEENRFALYAETAAFLAGGDDAAQA